MATVKLGPLVGMDGQHLKMPIRTRTFYLWVHWDQDPGTAFSTSDLQFVNESDNDQSGRIRSLTPIGRKGNSFIFYYVTSGIEDILIIRVPANVFDNNEQADLPLYIHSYPPAAGGWTLPTTTVTSADLTTTVNVIRPRPHTLSPNMFTLTGLVNGIPYESKEAITSFSPTTTSTRNQPVTVNIKLPHNSKGILRIRIDSDTMLTNFRVRDPIPELYPVFGPTSDRYSQFFQFDTTSRSSLTIERGSEGTVASAHTSGSTIQRIDHIIDIRDGRWMVKPINELQWRTDISSLKNQIRIIYGDNKPYYDENAESVTQYGGKDFEMRIPLQIGQIEWVRWIADTFLETYSEPKYIANIELVPSYYLKLGDIIYLREKDNNGNVVQVIEIEHEYGTEAQSTNILVRQI